MPTCSRNLDTVFFSEQDTWINMKYRDLIQFDPIESFIELLSADNHSKAEELVRSYVMSDNMAELISAKILSQVQLTHVVDKRASYSSATTAPVNCT